MQSRREREVVRCARFAELLAGMGRRWYSTGKWEYSECDPDWKTLSVAVAHCARRREKKGASGQEAREVKERKREKGGLRHRARS